MLFFFFKQKSAYEMRISDWSSDVCSSDLVPTVNFRFHEDGLEIFRDERHDRRDHETDDERGPVLVRGAAALHHLQQLVAGGRVHRGDTDQEREQIGRASWREWGRQYE